MYRCKHFGIKELVSQRVYMDKGESAWRFFRPTALQTLDKLRDRYGKVTCNDWAFGGSVHFRGLRLGDEYPASSWYSAHRHGCAFDAVFANATAEEVRHDILARPDDEDFRLITELELDVTWLHFACDTNVNRIFTFRP